MSQQAGGSFIGSFGSTKLTTAPTLTQVISRSRDRALRFPPTATMEPTGYTPITYTSGSTRTSEFSHMSGDAAPATATVYQIDSDDQDMTELRPPTFHGGTVINGGTISDTTSEGDRSRLSRRHRSGDRLHRGAPPSTSPTRSGLPFVHVTLEAAALFPPTATDLGGLIFRTWEP